MRMTTPSPAFPFDARIPELAHALEGEKVGLLLRDHLCTPESESVDVQQCRVVRLRYRPEDRCVVQYAVTVRDPHAAISRREFVTGIMYGDPQRAARRAARLPGAVYLPELRMLVSLFPSDRKLPHAPTIVSGDDDELKAAILRSFGAGSWRVDRWTSEVVRYRQGLSLVVRYTVVARDADIGSVRQQTFYAKAYRNAEAARRTFTFLGQLAAYTDSSRLAVRVQGPIAWLAHLSCVLFTSSLGRPLSEMLASDDEPTLLAATAKAAHALAQFNMSDAPMVREFSVADYLQSLKRPVAILERACPGFAFDVQRALGAVRDVPDATLRPTHRDMKPEHVLIGASNSAFIDLDSCAAADPVLDVALMLARFGALALAEQRRVHMSLVAARFAEEYFAHVPREWAARLHPYYAASLLEVAASLFHRQEDGWQHKIARLIATSREVLVDRSDLSAGRVRQLTAAI